jgi:aspartate dehydrogenase
MIKVGIIGCGTIGRVIADSILHRFSDKIKLLGVCDVDQEKARRLLGRLKTDARTLSRKELIEVCDLIIEAASGSVSYEVAKEALEAGKDVMMMSTGGLLGKPDLFGLAAEKGAKIYLPSGAVCGLDGVKSAMMANVKSVTLTTRKPPAGLEGAPYIVENNINLKSIDKETVIFEGKAKDAVKGFPKNVNVSATLSLCGLGQDETKVRIITSPEYKSNSHEVEVEGDFGRLKAVTENVPSPNNPKTSYLAALSAIATLKNIISDSVIGN